MLKTNVNSTGEDLNLSPIPYRTVPDRYNFCHARGLLARSVACILPRILRFSARNSQKCQPCRILKIETVLAFLIDLYLIQKREPFRDVY